MKMELTNGKLSQELLAKIRKHNQGTDQLKKRKIRCHFCGHNTIFVYEDCRGHVQAKCSACGREAVYNLVLCRNGSVRYRLIA